MSGNTTELNLKTAVDADDTADYLTLSLADSLRTVDALFNNVSGHNHSGAHQGGPLAAGSIPGSAIADGAITSAKIADGSITSADIADGTIQTADIQDGAVSVFGTGGGFFGPSTTSTTPVAIPGMVTSTLTTLASRLVLVHGTITVQFSAAGVNCNLFLYRDTTPIGCMTIFQSAAANQISNLAFTYIDYQATAGPHTWSVYWSTNTGTLTALSTAFSSIHAIDIRR